MKAIIHYNGNYEDTFPISGDTIEELKETARLECDKRGWEQSQCWSEVKNG